VTIGDLSFVHRPQDYPRATAARLRALVPLHARRARVVLVPSEFTRADVIDRYGIEPERVRVVPNRVVSAVAQPGSAEREADDWIIAHGVGPAYLLYLGNLHPRKNVPQLIRCFLAARSASAALRDCQLVIAGGHWWRGNDERVAADGSPHVLFLGWVSDAVRDRLLARAAALAYLSLFEGFGLPPLEAMAHGVPVVASDRTSLPEVCGAAAVLVDPEASDQIIDGLVRVLTDSSLRARLTAAGRARAAAFDAERVGDAALDAFRFALDPASAHLRDRTVA
jgi:glycosyltransferase involved in cell wall biosynthesis